MLIFLVGGSPFTGLWFARTLAMAGHTVVAPLKGARSSYTGLRGERVTQLRAVAEVIEACPFGSPPFIDLANSVTRDLL